MLNKETQIYISVAKAPGNFGATVYNSLFELLKINAVYLPRAACAPDELTAAIRALGIRGCSVTMPLKSTIIPHLDHLDALAEETCSVNTIVNQGGKLTGYNADALGVLDTLALNPPKSALIYGAGAVVPSIVFGLRQVGCSRIEITARNFSAASQAAARLDIIGIDSAAACNSDCELLINATPASTDPNATELFKLAARAQRVFDLVVAPNDTVLISRALSLGKPVIRGIDMCKRQLIEQFQYYFDRPVELSLVDKIVAEKYL